MDGGHLALQQDRPLDLKTYLQGAWVWPRVRRWSAADWQEVLKDPVVRIRTRGCALEQAGIGLVGSMRMKTQVSRFQGDPWQDCGRGPLDILAVCV